MPDTAAANWAVSPGATWALSGSIWIATVCAAPPVSVPSTVAAPQAVRRRAAASGMIGIESLKRVIISFLWFERACFGGTRIEVPSTGVT